MTDPLDLDAVGQAELVRGGDISPTELVRAAIERAEARNPALNAIIHPRYDKAMAEAEDPSDGPFRGVPMVVKNALGCVAGEPYHLGMRVLRDAGHVAEHDSELVARYRKAGFVVIGSTNTPELALSVTTEPVAFGPSRNPWSTEHSTGGSSGGSAAAVAAGIVAVGHGNDMGGSIRVPSSHCGLFGLKPTYGRTTLAPDFNEYWGQCSHEHVLTRSVRDSAAVLDAVHGPAAGDISPAPSPAGRFAAALARSPRPLRIARFVRAFHTGRPVEGAATAALDRATDLLRAAGHTVVDVDDGPLAEPDAAEFLPAVTTVHAASELVRVGRIVGRELTEDDVEPWTWALASAGAQMSAAEYVLVNHELQRFRRAVEQWRGAAGHDLVLSPAVAHTAPPIGVGGGANDFGEVLRIVAPGTAFTASFNIAGWPAASVPVHVEDGLPIGVQLAAAYGREDLVLEVAAQIEDAAPWVTIAP